MAQPVHHRDRAGKSNLRRSKVSEQTKALGAARNFFISAHSCHFPRQLGQDGLKFLYIARKIFSRVDEAVKSEARVLSGKMLRHGMAIRS